MNVMIKRYLDPIKQEQIETLRSDRCRPGIGADQGVLEDPTWLSCIYSNL
jgi:hypothetical protein